MASVNGRSQPLNPSPSRASGLPSTPRPQPPSRQNSSATSTNGLGRSLSSRAPKGPPRPTRGSEKKVPQSTSFLNTTSNVSDEASEDDARAEKASIIDELKDRLQKAEAASEEFQRQLSMLQTRLDDSLLEQAKMEENYHASEAQVNDLEDEKVHLIRQKREMEAQFESERTAMAQDKAEQKAREEDLADVIQRLKASQREIRINGDENKDPSTSSSRTEPVEEVENSQFAPRSSLQRRDSNANDRIIMQKDRTIESLRLDIAAFQVKYVELENKGEGRLQELEKSLMETQITNARLREDNESFQLLLSEKTLNGDFSKTDLMQNTSGLGSLAEELESAEGESENYRRLEVEAKSLKEQNKALTLYVENIIGRLLQHKEFENILEKTPDLISGKPAPSRTSSAAKIDKDLPPPPPSQDEAPKEEEPQPPSFLQRARSVVGGTRRSRPMSGIFTSVNAPPAIPSPPAVPRPETPKDNFTTASSASISRNDSRRNSTHRRSQSEMPLAGAPLVNQMYRGPPSGTSSAMISPGLSPSIATAATTRSPFFNPSSQPTTTASSTRIPSGTTNRNPNSSSNSTFSSSSGPNVKDKDTTEVNSTSSPPRTASGSGHGPQYTGAVMTQNRLRPLRLVQENADGSEEEREREKARKKANRGSWMPGWMGRAGSGQKEEGAMF